MMKKTILTTIFYAAFAANIFAIELGDATRTTELVEPGDLGSAAYAETNDFATASSVVPLENIDQWIEWDDSQGYFIDNVYGTDPGYINDSALYFDGTKSIRIPTLRLPGDFEISMWLVLDPSNSTMADIIGAGLSYEISLNYGSRNRLRFSNPAGNVYLAEPSTKFNLFDGEPHHLTITRTGTNCVFDVDGVTETLSGEIIDDYMIFTDIMTRNKSAYYKGTVSDLRINGLTFTFDEVDGDYSYASKWQDTGMPQLVATKNIVNASSYDSFPSIAYFPETGKMRGYYRHATTHTSKDGEIYEFSLTNLGQESTAGSVLVSNELYNYWEPVITVLSSGDAILTYRKFIIAEKRSTSHYIISTDNGETWSSEYDFPATVTNLLAASGVTETKTGTLLCPMYGIDTVGSFVSASSQVYVARADISDPTNWSYGQPVGDPGNNESTIVQLDDGTLRMFVRTFIGYGTLSYADSYDDGRNWTDLTPCTFDKTIRGCRPGIAQFSDGRLLLSARSNTYDFLYFISEDDGETWKEGFKPRKASYGNMYSWFCEPSEDVFFEIFSGQTSETKADINVSIWVGPKAITYQVPWFVNSMRVNVSDVTRTNQLYGGYGSTLGGSYYTESDGGYILTGINITTNTEVEVVCAFKQDPDTSGFFGCLGDGTNNTPMFTLGVSTGNFNFGYDSTNYQSITADNLFHTHKIDGSGNWWIDGSQVLTNAVGDISDISPAFVLFGLLQNSDPVTAETNSIISTIKIWESDILVLDAQSKNGQMFDYISGSYLTQTGDLHTVKSPGVIGTDYSACGLQLDDSIGYVNKEVGGFVQDLVLRSPTNQSYSYFELLRYGNENDNYFIENQSNKIERIIHFENTPSFIEKLWIQNL